MLLLSLFVSVVVVAGSLVGWRCAYRTCKKKSEASASLFGLVKHIKQCGVAVRVRSEGLFYQHGNRGESLRVFGFESVGNVVLKVVAEAFAGPY